MRRRSTRVAWAMLAAWSASVAALVVLSVANGNFQRQPLANTVGLLLAFAAFMGVGALIVANRPGNAIGWVFAAIALLAVTGALAEEYAGYAVRTRPGLLPGGVLAGWYAGWAWYPTVALALVFTPLLFPDGRPPSPPWRLVAWLTGAVTALFAALAAVQPTIELDDGHVVDNPIGVAGLGDPEDSLLSVALGLLVLAAVVSLVVRFRRSRFSTTPTRRTCTTPGRCSSSTTAGSATTWTGPRRRRRGAPPAQVVHHGRAAAGRGSARVLPSTASNVLFAVGISFPPVAAGIAILRYRLYEIDRLINRTLVYGLVTVLLAGVYAGLVLVLGELSGGLAGGTPSWVVAGATLAVAALFQPARRRVQAVVDRRFNRPPLRRRPDRRGASAPACATEVDLDTPVGGEPLALVAAGVGFDDQAHFTACSAPRGHATGPLRPVGRRPATAAALAVDLA